MRDVRFPVVLRGYDLAEVDALLRRVAHALELLDGPRAWDSEPVAPASAVGPELRTALRGYARGDVEPFLVRCAHSLGERVREVPELAALTAQPRLGLPLTVGEVARAQFRLDWRGVDPVQVDALLDRVQALLPR